MDQQGAGGPSRQQTTELQISRATRRALAGYIARQTHHDYAPYASLRDIKRDLDDPPERQTQQIIRLVDELIHEHRAEVEAALAVQRRVSGSVAHGRGILESLRIHTKPMSLIDISQEEFSTLVPSFNLQIKDLVDSPPFRPFSEDDARAIAMARWFKDSFMRWVDPIKCPRCGGSTTFGGPIQPTEEESKDANRVELHKCQDEQCGGSKRFPRYTTDRKLVQTREGRCGEWAQLFYAFLRLSGLTARYVWADSDHVWTEYWSPALNHWVHVDSCEAAVNKNLLYDKGWGKILTFVIAVGPDGAEDVTRAYVSDWDACLARRYANGWSLTAQRVAIAELTIDCRLSTYQPKGSEEDYWARLASMDRLQASWMDDTKRREAEAEWQELGGRTSGPAEWRARRAELGAVVKPAYELGAQISGAQQPLGDAVESNSGFCLTSGAGQTSAVFNSTPISQSSSFRCLVGFRLNAPPGSGAADGIAVVFVPEIKLGLSGYGLGYSGLGGQGDFAVEIDTYRTRDHADDPPAPHISVHSPPEAHHRHALGCMDSLPNLSDARSHTLELLYDGRTRTLRGYLKMHAEEEVGLWEVVIPQPAGEARDWYVGMTGSCGGLWQKQEVLSWEMNSITFK